jgi:Calcineurin-like phosphoesterase/Purple acid Phosphatase, N-terminal domain
MNRGKRVIGILATGIAALLCVPATAARITRGPFLQCPGPDRMRVLWQTDVETTTGLSYGLDPAFLQQASAPGGTRTNHMVELTGLQPDTRYHYEVRSIPATGAEARATGPAFWFRTNPRADGGLSRFWVVGDSGYQYVAPITLFNSHMAASAAAGLRTDGFIMLGDNAYDIGTESQIQTAVFNRYASMLRNTPLWCAFGNHDGYSVPHPYSATTPHDLVYSFPAAGESGGVPSGSQRYYSFDHGDIHFICIDSFTPVNAGDAPGGAYGMLDWLEADLKACSSRWIVAFMHYGPYTKGSHDSDIEGNQVRLHVVPLLEQYGVDLVLAAHSHSYERSRLIDGHYGRTSTWNPATMLKQGGNGSRIGGADASGVFRAGAGNGAYLKPAATGRSGAVYAVCGASSSIHGWWGGSTALVSPNPHPVHVTNLNLIGGMVLQIEDNHLNGQFIDINGAVRDDFSIIKGATYRIHPVAPASTAQGQPAAQFAISREGVLAAENLAVSLQTEGTAGTQQPQFTVAFTEGQAFAMLNVTRPSDAGPASRYTVTLQPGRQSTVPGAALRASQYTAVASQPLAFGASPAATWFATWFGMPAPSAQDWSKDPDGDGMVNLLEYALGSSPLRHDRDTAYVTSTRAGVVSMNYRRPPGRDDLTYSVESSVDLTTWTQLDAQDVADGPPGPEGEPRKVVATARGKTGFLRLSVRLNAP